MRGLPPLAVSDGINVCTDWATSANLKTGLFCQLLQKIVKFSTHSVWLYLSGCFSIFAVEIYVVFNVLTILTLSVIIIVPLSFFRGCHFHLLRSFGRMFHRFDQMKKTKDEDSVESARR